MKKRVKITTDSSAQKVMFTFWTETYDARRIKLVARTVDRAEVECELRKAGLLKPEPPTPDALEEHRKTNELLALIGYALMNNAGAASGALHSVLNEHGRTTLSKLLNRAGKKARDD